MTIEGSFLLIKKTSFEWAAENPVLTSSQIGQEIDTLRMKRGNDVDPWNILPYDNSISLFSRSSFQKMLSDLIPKRVQASSNPAGRHHSIYPSDSLFPSDSLYPG